jgi:hypothetical protein
MGCRVCGHEPAADVVFRAHRGYVVMVRVVAEVGPYCRACGLATFRDVTALTMAHGWWSIVSWVVAPAIMLLNLRARRTVLRLPEPARRAEHVPPNMRPLPPGRPVFARPMPWLGVVLLAALSASIAVAAVRQMPAPEPGCVTFSETMRVRHARFVDCAEPHDARVLDVVTEWAACPPGTTRHADVGPRLYCLVDEPTR